MLRLRRARPDDVPLIHALVRELAEYERLSHEVQATEADLARALFARQPKVFCDIADWDGEPAGFSLWFYSFSTFAGRHGIYLEDLYVRPARRGRGIGRALIAGLARRCAEEGLARLEWAVLDWNAPSIAFYDGIGGKPLAGWRSYRLQGDALKKLGGA